MSDPVDGVTNGFEVLFPLLLQGRLALDAARVTKAVSAHHLDLNSLYQTLDTQKEKGKGVRMFIPSFAAMMGGDQEAAESVLLLYGLNRLAGNLLHAVITAVEHAQPNAPPASMESRRNLRDGRDSVERVLREYGGIGDTQANQIIRQFESQARTILGVQQGAARV